MRVEATAGGEKWVTIDETDVAVTETRQELTVPSLETIIEARPGEWTELRVVTTAEGFEVNSFVVWDPAKHTAAFFDTGWFADDLFEIADENELKVEHLFITHMHGDHVAAMGDVRKRWPDIQLHSDNSGAPPKRRVNPDEPVVVGVDEAVRQRRHFHQRALRWQL